MKKYKLHLALITALTMAGCSSGDFKQIPYGCDSEESDPYCASVSKIYQNSVENEDRNINVLVSDHEIKSDAEFNNIQSQVVSSRKKTLTSHTDLNASDKNVSFNPTIKLEQSPVYTPEKVHRAYRGPWKDDNDILHSGEHLFYTTPGEMRFGSLNDAGSASGMIEPVYPEDLGFQESTNDSEEGELKKVGRHTLSTADMFKNSSPKKIN